MQENQEINEIFEKNMEALAKMNPKLAEKIREHTAENIDFIYSLTNEVIMVHDGIPLHSLEDPIKEAKEIFDTVKEKGFKSFHFIFGMGLGYLFKRATMEVEGNIVVFEPCLDILRMTFEVVDFSEELILKNVVIIDDLTILKPLFFNRYYQGDFVGVEILPAYKAKCPDLIQEATETLVDLYRNSNLNQSTVMNKSKAWSLAALNNIFDIATHPNAYLLKDKLKNVPAVVVSAGPSLEYAIEKLKEVEGKVFIVAVGQALRALDKAGIKPDVVVVIENLNVSSQFEGVSYINDLTVVLQPMTHRSLYELPVKRYMINFPISDNIANWYGRTLDKNVMGFPNRGTVSISAFYVALCAGCSPIMLVGQDLAYRDGKMYANNSSYDMLRYTLDKNGRPDYNMTDEIYESYAKGLELTKEELENRRKIFVRESMFVKGWDGEDLLTTSSYKVFLDNYVDIAHRELADLDQKLINSSVGGAYIKGLDHMPLEEALKDMDLDNSINVNELIDGIFDSYDNGENTYFELGNAIKKSMEDLKFSKEMSKKALEIARKIETEINKKIPKITLVDKHIGKLGKLDVDIIKKIKNLELINPFIQKELFDFSKNYSRMTDSDKESEKINNLKNNIDQSIKLYEAIVSGADQILEILPSVLENNKDLIDKSAP